MGKLLRFPGGNESGPERRSNSQEVPIRKVNPDAMVALTNALTDYVLQISPSRRGNLLVEQEKVVEGYGDDELIEWVERSTPSQWKAKTMFFVAVVQQVRKRNLF